MRGSIAVLLTWALLPAAAAAQTGFTLHAGPSAPVGDLARTRDLGYHLGGGLTFPLGDAHRFRVELSWDRLGGDARGLWETWSGETPGAAEVLEGGAFSAFTALASAELGLGRMAGVATPYLVAGLGYALLTYGGGALLVDGERVTIEENRDSGLAGGAGAGVRIQMLETMAVFSELRVMAGWPFDDSVEVFFPLRLGVTLMP